MPKRRLKPLVSIKAHLRLALVIVLTVSTLGVPVAWIKGTAQYYSEASIKISRQFVRNLKADSETELFGSQHYDVFVQQQLTTLHRFDVMEDALNRLGESRYLFQKERETDKRAAERLAGEVLTNAVKSTFLITVGMVGEDPDRLPKIITAVVEAYLDAQKKETIYGFDERMETLLERREALIERVQSLRKQLLAYAKELRMTSFEDTNKNPYQISLGDAQAALSRARQARIDAEADLSAVRYSVEEKRKHELEPQILATLMNHKGYGDIKYLLYGRRRQLLTELSGLTEIHPGRSKVQLELEEIDRELERARVETYEQIRTKLETERRGASDDSLTAAQAAVQRAQAIERELEDQVDELVDKTSLFAQSVDQVSALNADLVQARKQLDEVDARIDYLELESNAPGFAFLNSPARRPDIPAKGGRKKLLMLIVAAATALGVLVPIAIDVLDKRIHSANDVERLLGFPPIGWIVDEVDGFTKSFSSDQIRRMSHAIDRQRRQRGIRSFVLTGVNPQAGTTTLTLEIARELSFFGVRTLAVETNALRPNELFSLEPSEGLVGHLERDLPLESVILPAADPFPERLPLGDVPHDRRIPSVQRLPALLGRLIEEYDLVLLDAPPLKLAADTELLIAMADATLVVVEAEGTHANQLKLCARALEKLNPPIVGSIANRVRLIEADPHIPDLFKERESGEKFLREKGKLAKLLT